MQRPWLNYHHLFYFKTIANEGGIARAAKVLRLGQPTLSTQLKQLEEALGHQLFEREKRRLRLTEAGAVALEYANEIFRLGAEMVEAINDRPSVDRIEVTIGALDSVPKHLTLKLVQKAQELADCVVSVVEGRGEHLLRELKAHRIDLLLSNYPPPVGEGSGLYAKCMAKMPVLIYGARKFAKLQKGFPKSLDGQPFVLPSSHSRLRQDIEHYFKLRQIKLDAVLTIQDTSLQSLLGSHGAGLLPLPAPAAEELVQSKELVVIGELKDVHEDLWLIAGERKIQNPIAAQLMKKFNL